ncbi:complement C4-B-like isoform X2 [Archocentrus centrarchus]|uniref:complement C4-B-like isoform X2 n=1 Tax=Archocentrus centrarchus TaxID=63155 RepID=UPI0011EA194D|nr:complement C4-B-like isoform X2 [Archocentrus centrarchus]
MNCHMFLILLLIWTVECSTGNRFIISAPNVFHVGVNERVFVQMGGRHLNKPVTLYLEHETLNTALSEKKTVMCTEEEKNKIVKLKLNMEMLSRLPQIPSYVMLVAESQSFAIALNRKSTRVLVSQHRGYIFIQTDQPIYNPTQRVKYRIFALDHTMRPCEEPIQISVINAAGNRILKIMKIARGGILQDSFPIPDVSEMGTWNITAHYNGDEANAAFREFNVQKFVLPSFDVNIAMGQRYILLNDEELQFTISAMYTYGEKVKGAYHCQFGVVKKDGSGGQEMTFIKRLELTGSVQDGNANTSLQLNEIKLRLQSQLNKTLSDMQKHGERLFLRVFVTNIQSGEIQEAEVYLQIFSHKYMIDLSRTRSHFIPGYPLDVVVLVRLPDGSPAAGVSVNINIPASSLSWKGTTDQEGALFNTFNIVADADITVEVSSNDVQERKIIRRASSRHGSYLYMTFTSRIYSVNELFTITFNTIKSPTSGSLHYMVLSRGSLIKEGSLQLGITVKHNLLITPDMVPSFRVIGYYHNANDQLIADSVWVDVRDECELNVKVQLRDTLEPNKQLDIEFDLQSHRAKVALLAVDKAFYALNADNKLTAKQVFSTMNSYDLGCSYGGGSDSASVLLDAGLAAVSNDLTVQRKELGCNSSTVRQRRSVDLEQEMMTLKMNYTEKNLQDCCVHGFSRITMERTCQERADRVLLVKKDQTCADVFLKCCLEVEHLRQEKIREELQKGFGRSVIAARMEAVFLNTPKHIRRYFPPSFAFVNFEVTGKKTHSLYLPDSITTWELQVVTLSPSAGFCVVKPLEVRAFKKAFVSLRLPYSVKKYEQLSVSPVIYNYIETTLQVGVRMDQTEGLCSPGSATTGSYVNITLQPQSSQFVSFSAVPMKTGSIPIKIQLYDMVNDQGIDAIEKNLNVQTEGFEKREEETRVLKLDGRSTKTITIDGSLPDDTIPDSRSNIFVSVEGNGFGHSFARKLLSPEKVAQMIRLPTGCVEQTMSKLAPTALALRYLDLSNQWFDLPSSSRDDALNKIEHGYRRIITHPDKKSDGSYGIFSKGPPSYWMTAYIVKICSLVAQHQTAAVGQQDRINKVVSQEEIMKPVTYLLRVQKTHDGSFSDPNPVIHVGLLKGKDQDASMTAFITIALYRSLKFLQPVLQNDVEASILRSTSYLLSHIEELQHPYAVAITAYCLSVSQPNTTDHSQTWAKLEAMAIKGNDDCYFWPVDASQAVDAITVETTAYALLTAVELGHMKWADKIACWLNSQENYNGGYKSTQDTVVALEALSEYELKRPASPETEMNAEFTSPGRNERVTLQLENKKERVETDLKKLTGNSVNVQLSGKGEIKFKIVKAYHLLEPKDDCDQLSISVRVEGKVKYTAKIIENYEYYDYDTDEDKQDQEEVPRSAIGGSDAHTRNRRDLDNNPSSNEAVTYTVCVRQNRNLTGMAIADITLLSGFKVETKTLDSLKESPEQYIAHYEESFGRVLIYFSKLFEPEECISFEATQQVPVGLLQPAPASFYDYYEPNRKCTVFYSAPQRSKMVSKLCSEDVCQCAETYIVEVSSVSVKSNFELYKTNITDVLKSHNDDSVRENPVRVFAKRVHCKGKLDVGKHYLIMGKDGTTKDSNGMMQYLLESNTWVEKKPSEECRKTTNKPPCREFNQFVDEYKVDGCTV